MGKLELWRLFHYGCYHDFKSQSVWMKAAGFTLILGPMLFVLALGFQDDFSWSLLLGAGALEGPSSFATSSSVPSFATPCLSRTQHMKLRPPSQIISPSSAWDKAFHAYGRFHAKCSQGRNWTEEFYRSTENCKVLVYIEGPAGLGNRLLSMVSAFLYALLTNRVFMVDTRGHVGNLLCEPFDSSSWLLPLAFPFDALDKAPSLGEAAIQNFRNSKVVRLHLDHAQSSGDQLFFCPQTRDSLKSVPWLVWTSNQYYVPRFFTFPELWTQLVTLFPNASLSFTHLSRYLLLPRNSIWGKIYRIYTSYLSLADELVGIQIRRHSVPNAGEYDDAAFHRLLYCLIDNKLLPNFSRPQGYGGIVDTSMGGRLKGGSGRSPVHHAVLVTSLQIRYFEELRDLYANMATVDGSSVRVHMVSHEGMEWHSYDQAQKAFVEMWLLSFSDHIATSSWSTFGYIAQGLGALRPFLVDLRGEILEQSGKKTMTMDKQECYFGHSIEPCNHFPFYPTKDQCGKNQTALSAMHQDWMRKYLQSCQDAPQGLQLLM